LRIPVVHSAWGTVAVRRTDATWTEDALTWLTPVSRTGDLGEVTVPPAGSSIALDVTSAVTPGQPFAVAIDRLAVPAVALGAREGGNGAQLVLSVTGDAQHRLATALADPDAAGARYAIRDDRSVSLDGLDVIEADGAACAVTGSPHCYLGAHHTQRANGHFTTALAASSDLLHWTHVQDLDDESSMPSLKTLPDGRVLLLLERDDRDGAGARTGSHVRAVLYAGAAALVAGTPARAPYDAPRTLSSYNEGTPDLASVDGDVLRLGLHYYNGSVDRQGSATLTGLLSGGSPTWVAQKEEDLDGWVRADGVAGNVGDRARLDVDGRSLMVLEGQTTRSDFGTWSLYVADPQERVAEPVAIRSHAGTGSWGNPSLTRATLPDGTPGVIVTAFAFSENSAGGQAGQALWTLKLP
jgi:hypothetical protein